MSALVWRTWFLKHTLPCEYFGSFRDRRKEREPHSARHFYSFVSTTKTPTVCLLDEASDNLCSNLAVWLLQTDWTSHSFCLPYVTYVVCEIHIWWQLSIGDSTIEKIKLRQPPRAARIWADNFPFKKIFWFERYTRLENLCFELDAARLASINRLWCNLTR